MSQAVIGRARTRPLPTRLFSVRWRAPSKKPTCRGPQWCLDFVAGCEQRVTGAPPSALVEKAARLADPLLLGIVLVGSVILTSATVRKPNPTGLGQLMSSVGARFSYLHARPQISHEKTPPRSNPATTRARPRADVAYDRPHAGPAPERSETSFSFPGSSPRRARPSRHRRKAATGASARPRLIDSASLQILLPPTEVASPERSDRIFFGAMLRADFSARRA